MAGHPASVGFGVSTVDRQRYHRRMLVAEPRPSGSSDDPRPFRRRSGLSAWLACAWVAMIAVLSSCDSKPEPCGTIPDSAAPHGAVVETSFPEFLEGRPCFFYTPHASQLRSGAAVPLLIM